MAAIKEIDKSHEKVENMDIGHEESKIELEEIPPLFSSRNEFEADERKQDKVPYGADDAGIGDCNKPD